MTRCAPGARSGSARRAPALRFRVLFPLVVPLAALLVIGGSGCSGTRGEGGGGAEADAGGRADAVLLVSMDGFPAALLDRAETPTLDRIAAGGVRAEALVPVFPTYTFPNHYTTVTGLHPDHHGIVANTMYDTAAGGWFSLSDREAVEDPRWWGGEPIWVTLQEQGGNSATVFWPGSEAPVQGTRPDRWMSFDQEHPYRARVDSILTWLALPEEERPEFLTLYFAEPDATAHWQGPDSPEAAAAAARVDTALGWLVAGLEERGLLGRLDILVTSDHGMAGTSPDRVIHLDDHLPEDAPLDSLRVTNWGAVLMMEAKSGNPRLEARALESLRGAHPRMSVYRKGDLPDRLHYGSHGRIPEIVAIADVGWLIGSRARAEEMDGRVPLGMHGYDNAAREMHTIFLARGPSFREGAVVEPFSNLHLYELMAHLLAVEPAPNDGSLDSVRAVLRER